VRFTLFKGVIHLFEQVHYVGALSLSCVHIPYIILTTRGRSLCDEYENHEHHHKGRPGRKPAEETKQKISTSLKGGSHPLSEEQKMKKKQQAQGCVGIHKASGKYQAIIPKSWNNGKQNGIGVFDTEEEAWVALSEYKAEHVGS
jgi:hypothetical protein